MTRDKNYYKKLEDIQEEVFHLDHNPVYSLEEENLMNMPEKAYWDWCDATGRA